MRREKKNAGSGSLSGAGVKNSVIISDTDPLGSYTGQPADPFESPVQDADDL